MFSCPYMYEPDDSKYKNIKNVTIKYIITVTFENDTVHLTINTQAMCFN